MPSSRRKLSSSLFVSSAGSIPSATGIASPTRTSSRPDRNHRVFPTRISPNPTSATGTTGTPDSPASNPIPALKT